MIPASLLRQMRADTLTSLHPYDDIVAKTGQQLEAKDWKVIGNYLRTTKNLRSLDLSRGSFMDLKEALKENRSIEKLNLNSQLPYYNYEGFIDVLKANPMLSDLSIQYLGVNGDVLAQAAKAIGACPSLTRVDAEYINYIQAKNNYDPSAIIAALKSSLNILSFNPGNLGQDASVLRQTCANNRKAAEAFVGKYLSKQDLSADDMQTLAVRFAAILKVAEEKAGDKTAVAQMLVNLEDLANPLHIKLNIPTFYQGIMATLPREFMPAGATVDFAVRTTEKPLTHAEVFNAAAAGQTAELLSFLHKQGGKLTADDYLFKPEGARENTIEVIARQGALAAFMNAANWADNARAFKAVAAAVPAREWTRQMGAVKAEQIISLINASSFKKTHQLHQ